jgi:DNA modification methylase
VLDPFAGTGTTVLAAHVEGCRGIGIELDPGYCETARKRLQGAGAAVTLVDGSTRASA